jgi:hypothetical protein
MPDAFELAQRGLIRPSKGDATTAALNAPVDHVVGSQMDEEVRDRLEQWLIRQLDMPVGEGEGRNNQMIQLAPRMFELGWDEEAIVEKFKDIYGIEDDSKDSEIWSVVRRAKKYVDKQIAGQDVEALRIKKVMAENVTREALKVRQRIHREYTWTMDEIMAYGNDMWKQPPAFQRRSFMEQMYEPKDIVWCGMTWETGEKKRRGKVVGNWAERFKRRDDWLRMPQMPGEFVSHCTFKPGTTSRCNDSADLRRYMVVESDTMTLDQIGSVFCYLIHEREAVLRAVVFSGKKSLHGWFDRDPELTRENLEGFLAGLECDPSVIRVSQPVRLAGQFREDTEQVQSLLYLA